MQWGREQRFEWGKEDISNVFFAWFCSVVIFFFKSFGFGLLLDFYYYYFAFQEKGDYELPGMKFSFVRESNTVILEKDELTILFSSVHLLRTA